MMRVEVVLLPADLRPGHVEGRTVVVFDVLRATTSMTAALAAGVREIRIFPSVAAVREAAARPTPAPVGIPPGGPPALLCGEEACLPPPGFDLGNSPGAFSRPEYAGRTLLMCTTNGTRALIAARGAAAVFAGALVNASAVARAAASLGHDVTLLCAGTGERVAKEDLLGAGAVFDALRHSAPAGGVLPESDTARIALDLFAAARADLPTALADSTGGRNVLAAGLGPDIAFAARLDALDTVGAAEWEGDTPVVTRWAAGGMKS